MKKIGSFNRNALRAVDYLYVTANKIFLPFHPSALPVSLSLSLPLIRLLVIDATSSVNFSSWITRGRLTMLTEQFSVRRHCDGSVWCGGGKRARAKMQGTRLRANTKFCETFLAFLISLSGTECLLLDASRRCLCHEVARIPGLVQISRKMVLHLQSTPFQYPFFDVLFDSLQTRPRLFLSPAIPATFSGIIDSDTRPDTRSRFVILIDAFQSNSYLTIF